MGVTTDPDKSHCHGMQRTKMSLVTSLNSTSSAQKIMEFSNSDQMLSLETVHNCKAHETNVATMTGLQSGCRLPQVLHARIDESYAQILCILQKRISHVDAATEQQT